MMQRTTGNRNCTQIEIEILQRLQKGPVGIYSRKVGSLDSQIGTDRRTFTRALQNLERKGFIRFSVVRYGRYSAKTVELTETGRAITPSAIQLLA